MSYLAIDIKQGQNVHRFAIRERERQRVREKQKA